MVKSHISLKKALCSSLNDGMKRWKPNEKVGPEIFGVVCSDPRVRSAIPSEGCSWQDCRKFIEFELRCGYSGDLLTKTCQWDDDIAAETAATWLDKACGGDNAPAVRHRAIRVLLRFFPERLNEHMSRASKTQQAQTNVYFGYERAETYWNDMLVRISCAGTEKTVGRICCQTDVKAQVSTTNIEMTT